MFPPTPATPNETLVIMDPGMRMEYGHHFAYNSLFRDGLPAYGVSVSFLLHADLPEKIRQLFPDAQFNLLSDFYANMRFNISPGQEFMQQAELCADEFRRAFQLNANQLLFAHTLDPLRLTGVALWYAGLPPENKPRLALNLMLGVEEEETGRTALKPAIEILTGERKVKLFGGTRRLAALLSELSGQESMMLPTPMPAAITASRPDGAQTGEKSSPDAPLLFGMTGDARRGKNLHLLPSAIIRYLRAGGKGNVHLQLTPTDAEAHPEMIALAELRDMFPQRVTLAIDRRSEQEYYAGLSSFSALLLPYGANAYNSCKPSGPAIESAVIGVPLISCAGGFIEDEIAPLDNGSIFIERENADALAEAMLTFEREAAQRRQKALAAAPVYRRYHSLENIIDMLEI